MGCAPEKAEDASQGSGAVNRDLGDLLELFHGDEQRICLPLQLHHHGGTHPVGTGAGVEETANMGRRVQQEVGESLLHEEDWIGTPVLS